jgi:hypothetical protein
MRPEMPPIKTYAAWDLGHAALYAAAALLSPAPAGGPRAVVLVFAALLTATAVGLLLRARWGRLLGLGTSVALLVCAFVSIALLVASAAYLRGIFGGFGEGAALVCLVAVALLVEVMVLLPAFQVRFLLRDDVRRHFGQ